MWPPSAAEADVARPAAGVVDLAADPAQVEEAADPHERSSRPESPENSVE